MVNFKPLDPDFPIQEQLGINAGPVVLVNLFTVDPAEADALIAAWQTDALWMKKQPGYISTQLHKAVGDSSMYLNYAVWESVESFKSAFTNPEFQKRIGRYPESATVSPHLFKTLAVAGHCVA